MAPLNPNGCATDETLDGFCTDAPMGGPGRPGLGAPSFLFLACVYFSLGFILTQGLLSGRREIGPACQLFAPSRETIFGLHAFHYHSWAFAFSQWVSPAQMAIAQMWRDDMMMDEKTKDSALIGSDRVEGTAVYGRDGDKIGTVQRVLLEKQSGQARDVEISVGSFLGMGGELHSLPWQKFDYDTDLGGYKLNVTEDELRDAPTHKETDRDAAYDREHQTEVYRYWTVSPYW
jgi:hypothetical protein